jgi:hypothetical protein
MRHEALSASAIQRDDPRLWSATIEHFGSLSAAALNALREKPPPRSSSDGAL